MAAAAAVALDAAEDGGPSLEPVEEPLLDSGPLPRRRDVTASADVTSPAAKAAAAGMLSPLRRC